MLGLGNSVGTPPDGIEAEAVVVGSFDELDALGPSLKGKIVVYNVPWTGYGETVQYRSAGASRAAAYGAVGVLLRSVGQPGPAHAAHRRPAATRPSSRRFRRRPSPTKTPTGCSASRTAGTSSWSAS